MRPTICAHRLLAFLYSPLRIRVFQLEWNSDRGRWEEVA